MNPQEIPVAKLLRIHGRVQGVGYRESMRQEAKRLNVGGWVRNRRDGTVEALVCGEAVRIEMMVAWAKQGPRYATVERVEISEAEIIPGGEFQILYSS
jgi:acylphosphatase